MRRHSQTIHEPRNIVRPMWYVYFWLISVLGTACVIMMGITPDYAALWVVVAMGLVGGLAFHYHEHKKNYPVPK